MRSVGMACVPWRLILPIVGRGLFIWIAATEISLGQAPARKAQRPTAATPKAEPTPATPPDTSPTTKWIKTTDLTNRYRFVERYPREDGRDLPGSLPAYRVGLVEVVKEVVDQLQATPRRAESTRQTVFVERTTEQASIGGVAGSVRFIESYQLQPADPARTMGANPLNGLTLGLRYRATEWPLLIPQLGRKPTDYEFEVLTRQMVVPLLTLVLPTQAVRIGDSWQVPRRGAAALLGDPQVRGETLTGKFTGLHKEMDGARQAATINVAGRLMTSIGEAAVNAEITFTFQTEVPARSPLEAQAGRAREGLVEARGGITEVRLARTATGSLPGPGRLKFQSTREVTMERQFDIGAASDSLPRQPPPPRIDDPTAWLTWVDVGKRYRLDHPQDILPPERPALTAAEPNSTVLVRNRREGVDMIQLDFLDKVQSPADLKAKLNAKTALMKIPVIRGDEGWLPEADWPIGKVYRIEAAVQIPDQGDSSTSRATRVHFDAYLIQPGQAAGILAIATTSSEASAAYRREVEQILKTIQIDPASTGMTK